MRRSAVAVALTVVTWTSLAGQSARTYEWKLGIVPVANGPTLFSYDRIAGMTIGRSLSITRTGSWSPSLELGGLFRSAQGRWIPVERGALSTPYGAISVTHGEWLESPDGWILPQWRNTLSALVGGADARDWTNVRSTDVEWLVHRDRDFTAWEFVARLRDEQLGAAKVTSPWSAFGRPMSDPNPLGLESSKRRTIALDYREAGTALGGWFGGGAAGIERGVGGDSAGFMVGRGDLLVGHPLGERVWLIAEGHARSGTSTTPADFETHIGGYGTLSTLPRDSLRGRNLLFGTVQGRLKLDGEEDGWAVVATLAGGMAWDSVRPTFQSEIGAGFGWRTLLLRYVARSTTLTEGRIELSLIQRPPFQLP